MTFLLFRFAKQVTDLSSFLPYIIPTVVQRLGQPEIVEPCEELRLYIVELLCSVIEICREKVGVYIDDMIKILQRTLVDPFHDVRKVSFVGSLIVTYHKEVNIHKNIFGCVVPEKIHSPCSLLVLTPLTTWNFHFLHVTRISSFHTP